MARGRKNFFMWTNIWPLVISIWHIFDVKKFFHLYPIIRQLFTLMHNFPFSNTFIGNLASRLEACVWARTPTRGDCGYIWDHILRQKLENFFFSLIMGFIMGGSEYFSEFLSGLSHRWRPRACVWACTPTRGDCGHLWDWKFQPICKIQTQLHRKYPGFGQICKAS